MKKKWLICVISLLIFMHYGFSTLTVFAAEEVLNPGVTVTENTDSSYDGDFKVKFVYQDTSGKKIEKISVSGNFQFSDKNDSEIANGNYQNAKVYSAYEYKDGMFNHTNNAISYELEDIGDNFYSVELPLPGNLYYYDYTIKYENEDPITIQDPTNPSPKNENNGHDSGHSLIFVGNSDQCIEGQEYVFPRNDKTGTVEYLTYTATDGTQQPLGVYLPYHYDPNKTYKTIYMSHGGGGNETDWFTIGSIPNIMDNLIAEGKTEQAIVVTMDHTFYNFNFETFKKNMSENIIPFIEENYSVSKEAKDRSFGGLSRPTFGDAVPRMLTVASALEWTEEFGYYFLSCAAGNMDADGHLVYNETDAEATLFVTAGSVDLALAEAQVLHQKMEDANIEHMWEVFDGGHDWAVWRNIFTKYASEVLWSNESKVEEPVTPEDPVVPEEPVSPEKPTTPDKPDKPINPDTPDITQKPGVTDESNANPTLTQTGDMVNLTPYVLLAALSGGMMLALKLRKKEI